MALHNELCGFLKAFIIGQGQGELPVKAFPGWLQIVFYKKLIVHVYSSTSLCHAYLLGCRAVFPYFLYWQAARPHVQQRDFYGRNFYEIYEYLRLAFGY
jgi:hypothetical protein